MSCYFCDGSTYRTRSSLCEVLGHTNGEADIGLNLDGKPVLAVEISDDVPIGIECNDRRESISVEVSFIGYLHGIK